LGVVSYFNNLQGHLHFEFDTRNYPSYKRQNEVLSLINRINPDQVAKPTPLSIKTLSSFEIGAADNDDFVRKIFFSLYIASMPQKNKVIRADKIISSININFNGINVKGLSEGEKKLLLIKFIMDVLSTEASLVLLDEPDAHIHISRKKEIKDFIDKDNFFTVLTSHSPSLLHSLDENNIRIIKNGDHGLEVIPSKKVKSIEDISGGTFTLTNATLAFATNKDILLVEGAIDYKYISKAIEVLKKTKGNKYDLIDFAIINCGGAGNIAAILEEAIIPYISDRQLCIAAFDCDEGGRNGVKSINKILSANSKTNIRTMIHPKIDSWTADDFVIEDYFPIGAYKANYEGEVAKAKTFKSLTSVQKPKGIIEKHYLSFQDEDYNNFEKLLVELLKLKKEFHGQP
jgi:energy-coupling factor transporter ATP-binding protein EcfA2